MTRSKQGGGILLYNLRCLMIHKILGGREIRGFKQVDLASGIDQRGKHAHWVK